MIVTTVKSEIGSISPGKVILTGEHSVVHGEPALVVAIDKYVRVKIKTGQDERVEIVSEKINVNKSWMIDELREYWIKAHEVWKLMIEMGEELDWKKIISDQSFLVKASVGLVYEELGVCGGVEIEIESDIPVGAGFGSSASVSTAVVGGLGEFFGSNWSRDEVYERALMIEQLAHGRASGVDPAAVVYGGLVEFTKVGEKKVFEFHKVTDLTGNFVIIQTGKPSETTGEMVNLVNSKLKYKNSKLQFKTKNLISQIGMLSREVINGLKSGTMKWGWIKENERLLEELGVVGSRTKEIIESLNSAGISAKVCGAGGIKNGSGIVLAYHDDEDKLEYVVSRLNLKTYKVKLGVDGWQTK